MASSNNNKKFDDHSFKQYMSLDREKMKNRRRITFITVIAYIIMISYTIVFVDPTDIQYYVDILSQLSLVVTAIVAGYFGTASYERTKVGVDDRLSEYEHFNKEQEPLEDESYDGGKG